MKRVVLGTWSQGSRRGQVMAVSDAICFEVGRTVEDVESENKAVSS